MSDYLFISDAAKEVKVESHVLRYWEEELHLPIKRNELGHRYYTEEDVERFKQIKSMKERGLQLKAIKMILRDGKLDVLSMEETGIDRAARRNQAEPGADIEMSNAGMEDSVMYQSQTPISDIEIPQTDRALQSRMPQIDMPDDRASQSRIPQGRMPEARETQPRTPQADMPETRGSRSRLPQAGMPEIRGTQSRLPQTDMPEARGAQSRLPQASMPEKRMSQSRMSEESRGLAIDIISAKEKEPAIQESREDKSRRLQWLLQQLIRQTLQENNIELCREIRDSVVKELDYQFRMQEEREDARDRMMEERNEEHYRKMDELIRKKSRRLRKMKPDKEQNTGIQEKKGNKADEKNKKGWDTEEHDDKNGEVDEWDQWSKGTGENNQKEEEAKEHEKKGRKLGEKSKWKQDTENQENAYQPETATITKKKRRFF